MAHARVRVSRFDDRGATAVEYALIAALIAVVIVVSVALLGGNLLASFTDTNAAVEDAVAAAPDAVSPPEPAAPAAPAGDQLLSVVTTGGGATTIVPKATWERIGSSRNYRWECRENGFALAPELTRPVRSSVAKGTPPSCG